jgi:hypothetical protein
VDIEYLHQKNYLNVSVVVTVVDIVLTKNKKIKNKIMNLKQILDYLDYICLQLWDLNEELYGQSYHENE